MITSKKLNKTYQQIEEEIELKLVYLNLTYDRILSLQKLESKKILLFCYQLQHNKSSIDIITFVCEKPSWIDRLKGKQGIYKLIVYSENEPRRFSNPEDFIAFIKGIT